MKYFLSIALFFFVTVISAQANLELTPQGFMTVESKTPNKPLDQLIRDSKSWAAFYNKKGSDVSEVTENSLTVDAKVENAYFMYNVGMKYNYDITYKLKIAFDTSTNTYSLKISVKDIFTKNIAVKTTVADFFTPEGKIKDDYRDAKPLLEKTINKIVKSYINFMAQQ